MKSASNAAVTAFRLEGIPPSIAYRRERLQGMLKPFGSLDVLKAEESRPFWRAVRDALPFAEKTGNALWRISVTPSEGAKIGGAIMAATGAELFYDWAGGLIWVEMPGENPHEEAVRGAIGREGHALLVRANPSVRASAAVFGPLDDGLQVASGAVWSTTYADTASCRSCCGPWWAAAQWCCRAPVKRSVTSLLVREETA